MMGRFFDGALILISGVFIVQAWRTPPETYDVMGPALWPMGVACGVLALLAANLFLPLKSAIQDPVTPRLGLFALLAIGFVSVQMLDLMPFYLSSTLFLFLAYRTMASAPQHFEAVCVAVAVFVFSFAVQTLFTTFIHLDLSTGF